jgi:LysR family cys regulon transcriptional activator
MRRTQQQPRKASFLSPPGRRKNARRQEKHALNLQQLRSLRETARQRYNLTEVAQVLHTSQPGVSRQIRELENELGVALFQRVGKRLVGLTAPGERVLPIVERLLQSAEQLRRVGHDFARERSGRLAIAATHSQARYTLPHAVRDFRAEHPDVMLHLRQGSPQQVATWLLGGGGAKRHAPQGPKCLPGGPPHNATPTEALAQHAALATLPCYRWTHVVLVPQAHPLALAQAQGQPLTLADLAAHPLISYEPGFTGRAHIDTAFAAAGLKPDFALVAMDADVIKTYVTLGLGVGIVAAVAYQPERDAPLVALDARHLFAANLTRLAVRCNAQLREVDYEFIRAFASPLTREVVDAALNPPASGELSGRHPPSRTAAAVTNAHRIAGRTATTPGTA